MPLFDYHCKDCGRVSELLMNVSSDHPQCCFCGSPNVKRNLYRLILIYPEFLNSGCPERLIPAVVARSHSKPTVMGPDAAAV